MTDGKCLIIGLTLSGSDYTKARRWDAASTNKEYHEFLDACGQFAETVLSVDVFRAARFGRGCARIAPTMGYDYGYTIYWHAGQTNVYQIENNETTREGIPGINFQLLDPKNFKHIIFLLQKIFF